MMGGWVLAAGERDDGRALVVGERSDGRMGDVVYRWRVRETT